MKKWLRYVEIAVDKLIPFLLLALLLIIIGEFAFHEFMLKYHLIVSIIDGFIIFVFILDLIFKYLRIRDFPRFIKASWLEIIAVLPFFLIFRLFESLASLIGISETVATTQKVVHVGTGIEKEVTIALEEGSRAERLSKFIRPASRSVRFFKLSDPKIRERTKKDIEEVELDIRKVEKKAEEVIEEAEEVPTYLKTAFFYEKPNINHKISIKKK